MWQIIYRWQKRIGTWLYMITISNTWKYKFLITEFEIRTVTPGPNYFRGPEWVRLTTNGDPVPDPSNFRWLYVNVARTIAICGDVELQSLQQLSTNTIGHSQFFILIVKEWNSLLWTCDWLILQVNSNQRLNLVCTVRRTLFK